MRMRIFMIVGVIVHLFLIMAVFDIYFKSPIQHGMTPHKPGGVAPAKRVVLFVADGLRADSLYSPKMLEQAPYLHSIITRRGSWGIAHTQVPTESRPGHVALLAGFNEDPSAITRGWKSNPVEFDSVINESRNAWCWGSPDIVDMFNKDNLSHIHISSYDAYMQDFTGKESPAVLDEWVFDEVSIFLKIQKLRRCTDFCEDGNFIFLHLLGLDTAGHSYKPISKRYIKNILLVDKGIEEMVNLFENFFGDQRTAYIFTADHGMTDWGSHGDGSAHETNVPFIAWGAGISFSASIQDVEQKNIAPLISVLIGTNIPINSMGVVPLNYLNVSDEQKSLIIYANARQLREQYMEKHMTFKESTMTWVFQPYRNLLDATFKQDLENIELLIKSKDYEAAINRSLGLIDVFILGLKYYQHYYQRLLQICVGFGFVGWIVYLLISIKDLNTRAYANWQQRINIMPLMNTRTKLRSFLLGFTVTVSLTPFLLSLPFTYYIYFLFPIFTWFMVLDNYKEGLASLGLLTSLSFKDSLRLFVTYTVGIQLLIYSFIDSVFLALLFTILAYREFVKRGTKYIWWIIGQVALGFAPALLDVQTDYNMAAAVMGCVLWVIFVMKMVRKSTFRKDKYIVMFQLFLLLTAFCNSINVEILIRNDMGLLPSNAVVSWIISPIALVCPLLITKRLENRVKCSIIALMTPYTLMATGWEHVFLFIFAQLVLHWLTVEHKLTKESTPIIPDLSRLSDHVEPALLFTNHHNVKQCFQFLAFIMLSYFGAGHKASINSFDPMWVRCFITVFSPFTMATLILIKLMIPFLIVMCVFRSILIVTRAQVRNVFLIILLFCDFMVLQFLFYVKNEGSWLEIGVSLSRFIVVNITTIFLLLLYEISVTLTGTDLGSWRVVQHFLNKIR